MDSVRPTICLDLDGTVLDIRERYIALHEDIAWLLGQQPLPGDIFWQRKCRALPVAELLAEWDEPARRDYQQLWLGSIENPRYLGLDKPVPGGTEALRELTERFDLTLVTMRRDAEALHRQLHDLEIASLFATVVSAGDGFADSKARLLRVTGSLSEAPALVVGDTEADVEVAREFGAPVVCVLTGIRDRPFLEGLSPNHLIRSIAQLPQLAETLLAAKTVA